MHVLVVTYCRAMLGANRALLTMMKDMKERYQVRFTVLMPEVKDGDLAEELEEEGIPYHIFPMKMWVRPINAKHKFLRGVSAQVKTFFLSKKILKAIQKEKYDIVYTNNSTVQYGAIIAKSRRLPHIWHIRELGRHHYDFDYSYPQKKRIRYFKEADRVIAISDTIKNYAENELCPSANILRIFDGIELKSEPRSQWNMDAPLRIAYVAALQPGKNQIELIYAAEKLINSGIDDFEVFLVGDGDDYRAELELYVAQHRLSKYIHFMGYREDVAQFLTTMDVGVICSKSEGFGLVTCEYMAASLPVIGAESGATPEIISDGVTGFLYAAGDINQLASRIRELYQNRDRIRILGNAGYEKVNNLFSAKKNTDKMYQLFSEVLDKKNCV